MDQCLELDGKLLPISASIEGSLPENTASGPPRLAGLTRMSNDLMDAVFFNHFKELSTTPLDLALKQHGLCTLLAS